MTDDPAWALAQHVCRTGFAVGSPEKPLTDAQFEAKFRNCARNAVRSLSDASVDAALAAIKRLETLPNARELVAPFAE